MKNNRQKTELEYLAEPSATELLRESERLMRAGNNRQAYELSMKATQIAPKSAEAWWSRANLAPSLEERVMSLNRLNELDPGFASQHHFSFFTIKEALDRDPFLAYHNETDELYRAINAEQMVIDIPKQRNTAEAYPPKQPSPLMPAYRLLVLSIFGLLVAGLGTLVFAPMAAISAGRTRTSLRTRSEKISATVVITLSILLFLLAMNFAFLLAIHLFG